MSFRLNSHGSSARCPHDHTDPRASVCMYQLSAHSPSPVYVYICIFIIIFYEGSFPGWVQEQAPVQPGLYLAQAYDGLK